METQHARPRARKLCHARRRRARKRRRARSRHRSVRSRAPADRALARSCRPTRTLSIWSTCRPRLRSRNGCSSRTSAGPSSSSIKSSKDELGLDHFEGRLLPGWEKHAALTALAYAWLQHERGRRGARLRTLPVVRAVITDISHGSLLRHASALLDIMLKLREIQLRI